VNVEAYFKKLESEGHSFEKCQLHYCGDWDEMPVCRCSGPEWDCCNCTDGDE